jgi:hypothetical protein
MTDVTTGMQCNDRDGDNDGDGNRDNRDNNDGDGNNRDNNNGDGDEAQSWLRFIYAISQSLSTSYDAMTGRAPYAKAGYRPISKIFGFHGMDIPHCYIS